MSPDAAKARTGLKRRVEPGWYMAVDDKNRFVVHLTAVQDDFPTVKGKKPEKGHGVIVELSVDGRTVTSRQFEKCGEEYVETGWPDRTVEAEGKFRQFLFKRTDNAEGTSWTKDALPSAYRGSVAVKMYVLAPADENSEGRAARMKTTRSRRMKMVLKSPRRSRRPKMGLKSLRRSHRL